MTQFSCADCHGHKYEKAEQQGYLQAAAQGREKSVQRCFQLDLFKHKHQLSIGGGETVCWLMHFFGNLRSVSIHGSQGMSPPQEVSICRGQSREIIMFLAP